MACSDITSVIDAIYAGQFYYILCPYTTHIGELGFPVLVLGALALGMTIQHRSVVPVAVWLVIGGSAILLNSAISYGLFSQFIYITLIGCIAGGLFLVLRRLGR
jgi:hypothetical protein|tara:strand:+ start:5379 stop:5690 length:312 start_codon:yes stop_codon:yes gene_type:complete